MERKKKESVFCYVYQMKQTLKQHGGVEKWVRNGFSTVPTAIAPLVLSGGYINGDKITIVSMEPHSEKCVYKIIFCLTGGSRILLQSCPTTKTT